MHPDTKALLVALAFSVAFGLLIAGSFGHNVGVLVGATAFFAALIARAAKA